MERLLGVVRKVIPSGLADAVRPAYHWSLAVLGETIYRFPGRQMTVIGVTGTNGKSTTANLIAAVLEAGGHKVGLMTTVNYQIGEKKWRNESKMTSLGRFASYKLLRQMADAGCTHAVVEVSSHALHWHRVWGVPFQTAVFTNLSRDHLDLHKSMEEYRNTKGKLFAQLRKQKGSVSVVNGCDAEAGYFADFLADHRYIYGTGVFATTVHPLAHQVIAHNIRRTATGSDFQVRDDATFTVHINLPGQFNVENALAAIAVGEAHGVKPKQIAKGLDSVKGVPGRMEAVEAGQPFSIIVDYAHTPDAFEKVLSTLRPITTGKLIAVYGATGDRDRGKRPTLGKITSKYADYQVLTEEDPASEDPAKIIEEILPGLQEAGVSEDTYEIIVDRRKAIRRALELAEAGDTVALLAKGHETVMTYADGKRPWSDQQVAAEEWRKIKA